MTITAKDNKNIEYTKFIQNVLYKHTDNTPKDSDTYYCAIVFRK